LRIHDTLAGRAKSFSSSGVRMLLCGPTVYDYSHAGHARMLLFYDFAARYFRHRGRRVNAVVNITDIDPKIFARARAEGSSPRELAEHFIGELLRDASALGIDGFSFARVSDYVSAAQKETRRLLDRGAAYSAGGNTYLDVSATGFGSMSKMSKKDIEDCRLDIAPGKRSPSDILLWNASERFDVSFYDEILGDGIPWWHMQDTSVAMANFGGTYDMHGGAEELVYPHHESHLAQLRTLTGNRDPVRLWTHTGLVYAKGEKMSKSLGNTVTIRELLARHGANAVRLYLLSRHYRERLDFADRDIKEFEELDREIADRIGRAGGKPMLEEFTCRVEDDFDTPGALKVMRKAARSASKDLKVMASIFGLQY
jgi:cysteinyl-tRNA synthetase